MRNNDLIFLKKLDRLKEKAKHDIVSANCAAQAPLERTQVDDHDIAIPSNHTFPIFFGNHFETSPEGVSILLV